MLNHDNVSYISLLGIDGDTTINWEAIGAIGEIAGALAVILTLGYLALQVRYVKSAATDQNRLARANGVREIMLAHVANDELRMDLVRDYGVEEHYQRLARDLGVSVEAASRADWNNACWFWLHWGQYSSAQSAKDVEELTHLIDTFYRTPGMRRSWETCPWGKPVLDPGFVAFVDEILAKDAPGEHLPDAERIGETDLP